MKKASRIFLISAAVMCVLQWLVPGAMILRHEAVLARGEEIKIRCQPIDPVDPFRGRYVRVRLDLPMPERFQMPDDFQQRERLFAKLQRDADGFVEVTEVTVEPPGSGLYLSGTYPTWRRTFDLGLDRYYMNERLAPEAEKLVLSGIRQDSVVWASVKVWKGRSVLSGLYVDGVPIEDLAQKQLNQSE